MLSSQILVLADPSKQAAPSLDLAQVLVMKVLPEFLLAVGSASWRRPVVAFPILPSVRTYDLPADCDTVRLLQRTQDDTLTCIGENPGLIAQSLMDTTPAAPSGYWTVMPGTSARMAVQLNSIPASGETLYLSYDRGVYWDPTAGDLDLDPYVPLNLQWGLVEGLKAVLYLERFGQDDGRYQVAAAQFEQWKMRGLEGREQGPVGDTFKYIR